MLVGLILLGLVQAQTFFTSTLPPDEMRNKQAVLETALSSELATDEEKLKAWLEQARPEDLGRYKM